MKIYFPTKALFFIVLFHFFLDNSHAQKIKPAFLQTDATWADSVLKKLTPRERIAQLIMVAAYSNKDKAHVAQINKLIKDEKIGGLIMMQGGPLRHANLVNEFQKNSKIPLLISIDGEWGPAMRLDSTPVFPKQMTLGAIQNDTLIFKMGAEIARQCSLLGIHVNFAPVADVNNNPSNPVINMRSFGDNKWNVLNKCMAYARGLESNFVLANAKHFPGHGDTDVDSHKGLPIIKHNRARLDSIELFTFKKMIEQGLSSLMIAHLNVPALHPADQLTTSISEKVVTQLLRNEFGFEGLVFTDALNMKGVSEQDTPEQVNLKALLAGNDILLFPDKISQTLNLIEQAIKDGRISQAEIDKRCKKILLAKTWTKAHQFKPIDTKNLYKELNKPDVYELIRLLNKSSIILARNNGNLLPLSQENLKKTAVISLDNSDDAFLDKLGKPALIIKAKKEDVALKAKQWLPKLKHVNTVVLCVHNPGNKMGKSAGLTNEIIQFSQTLKKLKYKVILVHFANPYALGKISTYDNPDAILQISEDTKFSREEAALALLGLTNPTGKFSVSVGKIFTTNNSMQYGVMIQKEVPDFIPSLIKSNVFRQIDAFALEGIREKAYPGCQILIAKNGEVVLERAYGHHTYDKKEEVKLTDVYDIASITKVASTTLAIMKLVDEGFFDLDKTLSDYIPTLKGTNKEGMRIRDILAHQAGLPAWIPFYKTTITNEVVKNRYYRTQANDTFNLEVADNMWMRNDYKDSVLLQLALCPINSKQGYKYSDLGYYFFQYIIEKHTGKSLDQYVDSVFYKPMQLNHLGYLPKNKWPKSEIIPTENDITFRKQLIHGYVHDQGAAMKGGVAGHAGLFANASDLAKIMQLLLNKGLYNGVRYINSATIEEFTKCQFCANDNRRGLGFDKPEMNYKKTGPTCKCVSSLSFGHTGFTGTIAWVDPDQQLIYIFLSNRVYPDAENKKLNDLGTRVKIQEDIYKNINLINKQSALSN